MTLHINVAAAWKEIGADGAWVNVSGVWKTVESIHSNVSGTWKDVYIRDNTGPAAPSNVVSQWVNEGMLLTWTDPPDADFSHMEVSVIPTGESPFVYSVSAGVESQLCDYIAYYKVFTSYLTPYDVNGNAGPTTAVGSMAWTGEARGRWPSPRVYYPTDSGTFRTAAWRGDVGSRVYQGSTSNGHNYGAYFYGDTIYGELRGTIINEMGIEYVRYNDSGTGGAVTPEFRWSTIASKASSPVGTVNDRFLGPAVCRNGSCWSFNIANPPSSWYDNFVTPASTRAKSIILYSDDQTLGAGSVSASYMQLYGYAERPLGDTLVPGRLSFSHSG